MAPVPSNPISTVPLRALPRGFTLLEVLAVLAVVAILVSLALPSMAALAQRQQLDAAAQALSADFSEARLEAARTGQVLYVQSQSQSLSQSQSQSPSPSPSPSASPSASASATPSASPSNPASANWCWSVATQAGCDCRAVPAPTCRLKAVRAADHPGVQLLQPVQARLDPLGTAHSGSSAAVLQSPQGDRLRVEVGPLGRSRICVPATVPARPTGWRYPAC